MSNETLLKNLGELAKQEEAAEPNGSPTAGASTSIKVRDRWVEMMTSAGASTVTVDPADPSDPSDPPKTPSNQSSEPSSANVVPIGRRYPIIVGVLAAAALFLFWIANTRNPTTATLAALPAYELNVSGGDEATRGIDPPSQRSGKLGRGSRVSVSLVPTQPAGEKVDIRAFVRSPAQVRDVTGLLERDSAGAASLSETAENLFGQLGSGQVEVVLLIARPGVIPAHPLTQDLDRPPSAAQAHRATYSYDGNAP